MKKLKTRVVQLVVISFILSFGTPRSPQPTYVFAESELFRTGDVFVGVSNGQYQHYDINGNLLETLSDGLGGFTTGCAFDSAGDLYTTNFGNTRVIKYDNEPPHSILQVINTGMTSPGGHSESIVFAANGDFYVGHADGNGLIHKYDAIGNLETTFSVAVDNRGTDWIDLASDQNTFFYTSEGRAIQVYDTSTKTQLDNFATLPGSGNAFALRLLPPGDGTGGLLVADRANIKRLNGNGNVIQTYDVSGENNWFALNLDPNGTSFWSADFGTSNFYKFNIETGEIELGPINTGTGSGTLFGICVFEEITTGLQDSDEDGLPDVWEINGVDTTEDGEPDLFLNQLVEYDGQIRPPSIEHKDIYVRVDWFIGEDGHSHGPDEPENNLPEAFELVREAFANAPADAVDNPDELPGINLHIVLGNAILEKEALLELGSAAEFNSTLTKFISPEFANLKKQYLQQNGTRPGMASIFHYAVYAHYLPKRTIFCPFFDDEFRDGGVAPLTGIIPRAGSDFIIAHQTAVEKKDDGGLSPLVQGGLFMHELGHTLNLGHGGPGVLNGENYKPNHLSVMNYSFSKGLLIRNDQGELTRSLLDYSKFTLPALNEEEGLQEQGVSQWLPENYGTIFFNGKSDGKGKFGPEGNGNIDWNFNGEFDSNLVKGNVNKDTNEIPFICSDRFTTLPSSDNEWENLNYKTGDIGTVAALIADYPTETLISANPEIPIEEILEVISSETTINQPPTANANGPYTGNEGSAITLDASGSSDPDGTITLYEWDLDNNGEYDDATGITTEVVFGDNGTFTAGLRVTDDGGLTDIDTAEITVNNVAPDLTLDTSGAIPFAGGSAFLGRKEVEQSHQASANDPGSDDLTFNWNFGASTTYFNDGANPDPSPSPDGVFPFSANDTANVTFDEPGVHTIGVDVTDDDGGTNSDSLPKVVTDNQECTRSQGFWKKQFSDKGKRQVDDAALAAYLDIANFASAIFSEQMPANTVVEARQVMDVSGPGLRNNAQAQLLAAWMNFAQGAVGWDQSINVDGGDSPFYQVMSEAETILLDGNASQDQLERAKDLAESVNLHDEDNSACESDDDKGNGDKKGQKDEDQGGATQEEEPQGDETQDNESQVDEPPSDENQDDDQVQEEENQTDEPQDGDQDAEEQDDQAPSDDGEAQSDGAQSDETQGSTTEDEQPQGNETQGN
ncbi:MAG: hypothetical protein KDJ97_37160 [Anaerolineae bacterium]|nr:hypothetical protein [Anaerolineae bacterium]